MSRKSASAATESFKEAVDEPRVDVPGIDILDSQQFAAVARSEIERTRAQGTPLSLLSIGIDRLEEERSSATAPNALTFRALASICLGLLRASDIVGRVDDATAVVLLPDTPARSTLQIAERLRTAIAAVHASHSPAARRQRTISIGAVTTRTGRSSYRALRSRADAKRDDARNRGGNRVEV